MNNDNQPRKEDQIIQTHQRIVMIAQIVFSIGFLGLFVYFVFIGDNIMLGLLFLLLALLINVVPRIMKAMGIEYRIRWPGMEYR